MFSSVFNRSGDPEKPPGGHRSGRKVAPPQGPEHFLECAFVVEFGFQSLPSVPGQFVVFQRRWFVVFQRRRFVVFQRRESTSFENLTKPTPCILLNTDCSRFRRLFLSTTQKTRTLVPSELMPVWKCRALHCYKFLIESDTRQYMNLAKVWSP